MSYLSGKKSIQFRIRGKIKLKKPQLKSIGPRATAIINTKLENKLSSYISAAAAAGVGILAISSAAEAKVVYTATYVKIAPVSGYSLDLNHDGTADGIFTKWGTYCGTDVEGSMTCSASTWFGVYNGSVVGNNLSFFGRINALRAGSQIGPNAGFIHYGNLAADGWRVSRDDQSIRSVKWQGSFANNGQGVRDRYIGIKFLIGNEFHYGWARISVSIPNPKALNYAIILTGYAYETEPNAPIIAGAKSGADENATLVPLASSAPEKPSLGLLARGADALAIWRRDAEVVASELVADDRTRARA
jgi:hypothetical protein